MSVKLCAALAVAATVTASAAGAVSLNEVQFQASDPSGLYTFDPNPFAVDSGVETTAVFGSVVAEFSFDFSDGGLLQVNFLPDYDLSAGGAGQFVFTVLTSGFPGFNGFELLSASGVAFDQSRLTFTPDSLSIAYAGPTWTEGSGFIAQIGTVPLPATLPLLAAGLAGLALLRRRRAAAAT